MKKLMLALILITTGLCAFERKADSFTYTAIGADLILPAVTIGVRKWEEDSGFDINLNFSSFIVINRLSLGVSHLKKFNNNTYLGLGAGAFVALVNDDYEYVLNAGVFPCLKFGVELESSFHEIGLVIPQISSCGIMFFPLVSYRFGF
jgi:hypothetical protein